MRGNQYFQLVVLGTGQHLESFRNNVLQSNPTIDDLRDGQLA